MTTQSALGALFHGLTMLAFIFHIAGGALGLVSGTVAALARKGGPLHRRAGRIFVYSMLVMGVFAIYLSVAEPDQLTNVFIGTLAIYLVATAWMAVQRKAGTSGQFDKIALVVGLCLCAPFAILSVQLATGLPPLFKSAVPFKGPVVIAIYAFTSILAIAVIGDARIVLSGALSGIPRISRHLWRMCLGLTLAAGSGFTNGFARLLPGPYHVPTVFFLPQFLPLGLLVFWLIRVRLKSWANAMVALLLIVSLPGARAADSARGDASSTRFDGVWETILTCPDFHGALGYSFKFASTVKAGLLHAEKGTPGEPGWLQIDGPIDADGKASLYADGLIGAADFAVGRRPAGTQYGYHIDAVFTPDGAEGHRVEGRPCSVVWTRQR